MMIVLYTSDLDQPTILNEMRSLSGRDFSEQRHREWYKSGMEFEIVHRILLTLCRSLDLKRLNRHLCPLHCEYSMTVIAVVLQSDTVLYVKVFVKLDFLV